MPPPKKPTQASENKDQSKWWIWPAIVVGLMVLQIGFSMTTVYFAMTDKSFAVEPSYYSRAINWDSSITNQHSDQGPAWKFNLSIDKGDSLLGQSNINLNIMEASGDRITGAEVIVVGFHHANSKVSQRIAMHSTEIGGYQGKLVVAKEGLWEFQITARLGEKVCENVQTVSIEKLNF